MHYYYQTLHAVYSDRILTDPPQREVRKNISSITDVGLALELGIRKYCVVLIQHTHTLVLNSI